MADIDDPITDIPETPEEEQEETPDAEDIDTPEEDSEEEDDDTEDEGEEDVDEDADLPDGVRQLRAQLREQGFTFDAETGAPIAPDKPAAVSAGTPAAPEAEKPSTEAPAVFDHPKEFQGFSVRADGLDLFDVAFEDPDSADAQELIHGTEDQDRNVIQEGIGKDAYTTLQHKYFLAKRDYGEDFEYRLEKATEAAAPTFRQSVDTFRADAKAMLADLGDTHADAILGELYPKANQFIAQRIAERVEELRADKVPLKRAAMIANREVLADPLAYETATGLAILSDVKGFVKTIKEAVAGGATPAKPAATTPPRPPVPSVSRTGTGGATPAKPAAPIVLTPQEREMVRMRNITDPAEAKSYVRKLREYTKA